MNAKHAAKLAAHKEAQQRHLCDTGLATWDHCARLYEDVVGPERDNLSGAEEERLWQQCREKALAIMCSRTRVPRAKLENYI